ncbi:MAG: regulatory protein RecX [Acidobacteriota bacterium]
MAFRRKRTDYPINRARRGTGKAYPGAEQNSAADEDVESKPRAPLSEEKARQKAMNAALKLLAARARSEQQLREKLLEKSWLEPQMIEQAIARLKELGYINDRSFALNYAESRLSLRAIGKSRLRRELVEKKVPRAIIEETFEKIYAESTEENSLQQAIDKHLRIHGLPDDPKSKRRIIAHLIRQGFSYDLIMKKLRLIENATDEEWT